MTQQMTLTNIEIINKKSLKVYKGTKSTQPRVLTCTNFVNDVMEYAVGRLYVNKHFNNKSKEAVILKIKTFLFKKIKFLDEHFFFF
jgi:predicted metalloendopeptidase